MGIEAEKIKDSIILNWIGKELLIELEITVTKILRGNGKLFGSRTETTYQGKSIPLKDFFCESHKSGEKIMAFSSDGKIFREYEKDMVPIELLCFLVDLGIPSDTIIESFPYPGGFNLKELEVCRGQNLYLFDNKTPIIISWRDINNPFDKTKSYGLFSDDEGKYELKMACYSSGISFSSEDERGARTEGSGWYPSQEPLSLSANQIREAERILQSFLEKVDQEKRIYQEALKKTQDEYNEKLYNHSIVRWFMNMSDICREELKTFLGKYTYIVGKLEEKWLVHYLIEAAGKKYERSMSLSI